MDRYREKTYGTDGFRVMLIVGLLIFFVGKFLLIVGAKNKFYISFMGIFFMLFGTIVMVTAIKEIDNNTNDILSQYECPVNTVKKLEGDNVVCLSLATRK